MDLKMIDQRVRSIAEKVASGQKLEFVRSELAGTKRNLVVRVFLDRPDGITLDDCAQASREIEAELDREDIIPGKYVLEVSSPGIERELTRIEDFARFAGKLAKIKTSDSADGTNTLVGRIERVEGDEIFLTQGAGKSVKVLFHSIRKANLKIDLDAEFRR